MQKSQIEIAVIIFLQSETKNCETNLNNKLTEMTKLQYACIRSTIIVVKPKQITEIK